MRPIPEDQATFNFEVNLLSKDIAENLKTCQKGITVMSKAFNTCRRSFHIKLDIDKTT